MITEVSIYFYTSRYPHPAYHTGRLLSSRKCDTARSFNICPPATLGTACAETICANQGSCLRIRHCDLAIGSERHSPPVCEVTAVPARRPRQLCSPTLGNHYIVECKHNRYFVFGVRWLHGLEARCEPLYAHRGKRRCRDTETGSFLRWRLPLLDPLRS